MANRRSSFQGEVRSAGAAEFGNRRGSRKNETNKIQSTIQTSRRMGMVTLDDFLLELVKKGAIEREIALEASQDPRDLETRL
jgi:Tfp pilus assembly pilus retraction ATPase PilT